MKRAIGDADWHLLAVSQDAYSRAKRDQRLAIETVAKKLAISEAEAFDRLEDGLLIEQLATAGVEVFNQRECQSAWPDAQTLFVWALMVVGAATVIGIV